MKADFSNDRRLVWLASYPKSGNTWLRAMLAALARPDRALDLNALPYGMNLFDRHLLDDFAAIDSSEMNAKELVPYQSQLFTAIAQEAEAPVLAKTHAAVIRTDTGLPLFPSEVCAGAVYLYRDPVDVAVSYAHHDGKSLDEIIDRMSSPNATLHQWSHKGGPNLPQFMGRWREHLASWSDATGFPVLLLKYEDMLVDPARALRAVSEFLERRVSDDVVRQAVARCQFDHLAKAEAAVGFAEKPPGSRPFFRTGRTGDGEKMLSSKQLEKLALDRAAYFCHSSTTL